MSSSDPTTDPSAISSEVFGLPSIEDSTMTDGFGPPISAETGASSMAASPTPRARERDRGRSNPAYHRIHTPSPASRPRASPVAPRGPDDVQQDLRFGLHDTARRLRVTEHQVVHLNQRAHQHALEARAREEETTMAHRHWGAQASEEVTAMLNRSTCQ